MDEKDLRRLRRQDLLEMLLERTREVEDLRAENAALAEKLSFLEQRQREAASLEEREQQLRASVERLDAVLAAHECDLDELIKKAAEAVSKVEASATSAVESAKQQEKAPTPAPVPQKAKLLDIIKPPKQKKRKKQPEVKGGK